MRGRLRPCLIVSVVALIVAGWPASVADVATRVLAPEHLPPSSHAAAPAVEGTLSVDSLPSALRRAVLNAPYEVMPVEGGFSVATAAYRADFSDEGVTFAAAGTNDLEPGVWRYRLEAVERGVVRSALAPVTPVAESNSVEFRRPGVLERYVADGRGIEQVFVLDEPPGGSGDVDLVGQVDAGAASLPGDGQVVYRAPAAAAITYGRPFAFDAGGRPIPVETIVQGSTLRLRLDGAALAGAAFPVTIDPVIWGAVELYNATDSHRPAVAFNPRQGEFLIAFQAWKAATNTLQIRAKRYKVSGALASDSYEVTTGSSGSDTNPSVAYSRLLDGYYVAWQRWNGATSAIYAQQLFSTGGLYSTAALVSAAGVNSTDPDVVAATMPGPGGGAYMVVWRAQPAAVDEVWQRRFHPDASFTSAKLSEAGGAVGPPRVAYDPFTDAFFTVWAQDGQILGRSLTNATGSASTLVTVTTGTPENPREPALAFDEASRQFLVAWTDDRGDGSDHIYGQLLASGTPAPVGTNLAIDLNPGPSVLFPSANPVVAVEPGGFIVIYDHVTSGTTSPTDSDKDLYATHVAADGSLSTVGLGIVWSDAGASPLYDDVMPRLATAWPYGFTFMAWAHEDNVDHNHTQIWARMISGWYTRHVHGKSGNFDTNKAADYWVFRPGSGTWFLKSSDTGQAQITWGAAGDVPVLVDYDDDGDGDLGVFRPSNGTWYIRNLGTGATATVAWGTAGDVPVPGDYVGTTHDDYAVWRPWTGQWFIRDGQSGAVTTLTYGTVGDIPVPADWDGDGKNEIAIWRPATAMWYTRELKGTNQQIYAWGTAGDIPLPGNYVGSAAADYVVFRPANGTWYIRDGATGAVTIKQWGMAGDVPMPLDRDNDGYLNLAVWRVPTGTWYALDASMATHMAIPWGTKGDIPASGASSGH